MLEYDPPFIKLNEFNIHTIIRSLLTVLQTVAKIVYTLSFFYNFYNGMTDTVQNFVFFFYELLI